MVPVLLGSHREFFPPFHKEHAGITDFSRPAFAQSGRQFQFVMRRKKWKIFSINMTCTAKKPWQVWFACSPAHAQVYLLPKATPEVFLIALAVCETRAWRLCTADAAAVQTPVHFRLVKAKHLHSGEKKGGLNVYIWSVCTECLLLQQQEEVGVEENTPFTPTFAVQVRGEAQISVKSAVSRQKCV